MGDLIEIASSSALLWIAATGLAVGTGLMRGPRERGCHLRLKALCARRS